MNRDTLPPEIQQLIGGASGAADVAEQLATFSQVIVAKRQEAVNARKSSGIEDVWMECEESYLGIDDENRAEFANSKWAKPTTMDGPLRRVNSSDTVRSTAFVRLTSRYVDAGAAKIGEITQPIDDKAFSLTATPVPDLIKGKDDLRQIMDGGQPVMRDQTDDEQAATQPAQPGQPGQQATAQQGVTAQAAPQVPVTVADLAQHVLDTAADAATKAETRIYDWMVEYGHAGQMRKVTFDASRIGCGCIKGPVPDLVLAQSVSKVGNGVALQIEEKIVPVARWVDPWNLFPDDSCGEDIHDGAYILERDFLSKAKLMALKRRPSYIGSAIDAVIKEGPGKCYADNQNPAENHKDRKRFEIWYYYGEISLEDLGLTNPDEAVAIATDRASKAQANAAPGQDPDPIDTSVFAIVTLVNDTAIRVTVNPLESGSFPYHVVAWRRRAGHWAGVGVAEQVRLPQRIINGATRSMLNNAGQSAGPISVIDIGSLDTPDGNWAMTPGKVLLKGADATMDDVRKAFAFFQVPNVTPQLMTVIEYAFKLAEESSNIPLISQGQSGGTTPDTFGATQLQNNNANQLLRDVGFAFADQITNPLVKQFYEWLLLDTDIPDEEKGDFNVNCNAAKAVIERAIQDQTVVQMGQMVANPAFGIDPKKWFQAFARSKRLDPRDFQYTPEEMAKMAQQPPPPPVPVQVAQINTASAEKIAAEQEQVESQKVQAIHDRGIAYVQAQTTRDQANAGAQLKATDAQIQIANLNYQIALANFANTHGISTDKVKADLAQTAMKLKVQQQLSANDVADLVPKHHLPPVLTPPDEPAGRAPPGHAYEA